MTKRKVIFNEAQEVNKILENGFSTGRINYQELYLVAKHYKWIMEYGFRRIHKELILFCQKYDPFFNPVISRKLINTVVRQSMKHKLREIKTVFITQDELNTIRGVKNFDWQRILFVLLVLAKELKFSNQEMNVENKTPILMGYFVSHKYIGEVKRLAKIRIGIKKIEYLLHEFYLLNLVDHTYTDQIRIKYANDGSIPVLAIHKEDFDDLVDKYIEYCGGELLYCQKCGKEFPKTARQKSLCPECYGNKRRSQVRSNVEKCRKQKM